MRDINRVSRLVLGNLVSSHTVLFAVTTLDGGRCRAHLQVLDRKVAIRRVDEWGRGREAWWGDKGRWRRRLGSRRRKPTARYVVAAIVPVFALVVTSARIPPIEGRRRRRKGVGKKGGKGVGREGIWAEWVWCRQHKRSARLVPITVGVLVGKRNGRVEDW